MNLFSKNNLKQKIIYSLLLLILIVVLIYFLYYKLIFFHNLLNDLKIILSDILIIINYPLIKLWNTKLSLWNISIFLIIISVWLILASYYKNFIYSIRKKYNNLSYSTATILANTWYYLILLLVWFSSLKIVGLDFSSFTLIAWALSVWIWFWLKNIISNFVSWIILMFEKSIKVWDYVELSNWNKWRVVDIRIRSTTIKTNDNIDIIIPNQNFIDANITNWTLNDNKIRLKIPFWVSYWTEIKYLEKILLNKLKESNLNFMKSGDYTPLIIMKWMGNSSVNFELYIWIRGESTLTPNRTKSQFLKFIYTTLNENNIVIPFPQTDLHIKDSIPFEIKINKD